MAQKVLTMISLIGNTKRPMYGFTLLELLVALGISALVLVSSYSTLRIGWLSYGRLDSQSHVQQNLRSGLYKLSRELRPSFVFNQDNKEKAVGFKGAKEAMSFITLISSKDKEANTYVEVARVFYKFENKKIYRASLKGRDILKSAIEPEYKIFLVNIAACEFSYAPDASQDGSLVWENEFGAKDEKDTALLPAAVKVTFTQEFKDAPALTLTKSIEIYAYSSNKEKS